MTDYQSILDAAQKLPDSERLQLIAALWNTVPEEAMLPLSEEWESEIERRLDELASGDVTTIPWEQIRDEALARVRHDSAD